MKEKKISTQTTHKNLIKKIAKDIVHHHIYIFIKKIKLTHKIHWIENCFAYHQSSYKTLLPIPRFTPFPKFHRFWSFQWMTKTIQNSLFIYLKDNIHLAQVQNARREYLRGLVQKLYCKRYQFFERWSLALSGWINCSTPYCAPIWTVYFVVL